MNVDKSIRDNKLDIYTIADSLPIDLFDFVAVDSIMFLCRELSNEETQQIRYMLMNGEKIIPPHFEKLNLAKIKKGEDFNIISTSTKYNINNNRLVETPGYLNYVNIYSIDGSFGRTICVGKQLDHIGKIQDIEWTERKNTFNSSRLFSRFWGILFINEISLIKERKHFPSILLFDWNGEPLAQLNLNNYAITFDIDLINGYLYTFDYKTDTFRKYDIREILEKL